MKYKNDSKTKVFYYVMDLHNKKYVIANIKIPIEIKENNECETFMDLLNLDFTPIDALPEVITDKQLQKEIKDKLYVFLSNIFLNDTNKIQKNLEQPEKEEYSKEVNSKEVNSKETESVSDNELSNTLHMYIHPEEIHKKKKPVNTTFKKKHKNTCKTYTCKNYHYTELDNNGR